MAISEWLTKRGFKVINVYNRVAVAGPDIIAEKQGEKIVVEVGTEDGDNAIGKIIRRMDEYGFKNVRYYISCWYPDRIPKIVNSLGIGLFIVSDNGGVEILEPNFLPNQHLQTQTKGNKKGEKGEQLRIRCSWVTFERFKQFSRSFRDYEEALQKLLDNWDNRSEVRLYH